MIGGLPYNVVGLDPSLSHTAGHQWTSYALDPTSSFHFAIKSKPEQHAHPVARLSSIADSFDSCLTTAELMGRGAGLLVVEGYAYGASNQREALGEWGGQIRRIAHERGWRILVVPPTTLKKYVTGKGVAEKDMMIAEVLDRRKYKATDNNDADAYALSRLGLDYLEWERCDNVARAIADLFKVTPKAPKTEKKKAQKQKGLVVWEPST